MQYFAYLLHSFVIILWQINVLSKGRHLVNDGEASVLPNTKIDPHLSDNLGRFFVPLQEGENF